MSYRIIGEVGGIQVLVQGTTLFELFEHAALAVFDLSVGVDRVRVERDVPVMAVGDTPDSLLADWLRAVIGAAAEYGLVVATVAVDRLEVGGVQGAIGGYAHGGEAHRFVPGSAVVDGSIVEVPDGFWVRIVAAK